MKPQPTRQQQQQQAAKKTAADDKKVCITPIGIACFAHVFQPHAFEAGKDPNYSLILVFEKKKVEKDPAWIALRKGVGAALKAKFGEKTEMLLKTKKLSLPFRDAEEYSQYGDPFVEGNVFITIKSKNPPGVVNERSQPILNQMDFYAGCYARVSCLPWAFDSMGNKGCTLLLNNVQKAGDGDRISGRMSAEEEFDALEEGGADDGEDLLG